MPELILDDSTKKVIEIYRESIATAKAALEQHKDHPQFAELKKLMDEEISSREAHIRRLETDHAECVRPCCPACTMRGKKRK